MKFLKDGLFFQVKPEANFVGIVPTVKIRKRFVIVIISISNPYFIKLQKCRIRQLSAHHILSCTSTLQPKSYSTGALGM